METAIQWLELQFEKYTRGGVQVPNEKIFKLTEKAKQKEKEQIIDAHLNGQSDHHFSLESRTLEAEQHYNKTYNQNK